jgi:hypothetical protein
MAGLNFWRSFVLTTRPRSLLESHEALFWLLEGEHLCSRACSCHCVYRLPWGCATGVHHAGRKRLVFRPAGRSHADRPGGTGSIPGLRT